MTFVDTGGWYAAFVPSDPNHRAAKAWLGLNQDRLVTTDYVVDELLPLLRTRGEGARAVQLGSILIAGTIGRIEWIGSEDFHQAWTIFSRFQDKQWSFTDCVSRVVMARLGITVAFAFDEHFRQFGTVSVVP